MISASKLGYQLFRPAHVLSERYESLPGFDRGLACPWRTSRSPHHNVEDGQAEGPGSAKKGQRLPEAVRAESNMIVINIDAHRSAPSRQTFNNVSTLVACQILPIQREEPSQGSLVLPCENQSPATFVAPAAHRVSHHLLYFTEEAPSPIGSFIVCITLNSAFVGVHRSPCGAACVVPSAITPRCMSWIDGFEGLSRPM